MEDKGCPYKHSTSGPPAALRRLAATGWHRGGLQGGLWEVLQKLASSEHTQLSGLHDDCFFDSDFIRIICCTAELATSEGGKVVHACLQMMSNDR